PGLKSNKLTLNDVCPDSVHVFKAYRSQPGPDGAYGHASAIAKLLVESHIGEESSIDYREKMFFSCHMEKKNAQGMRYATQPLNCLYDDLVAKVDRAALAEFYDISNSNESTSSIVKKLCTGGKDYEILNSLSSPSARKLVHDV